MADGKHSAVPRDVYYHALAEFSWTDPYDPLLHEGMENPYTGAFIHNIDEYHEYAREHVYHLEADKHFDNYWNHYWSSYYAALQASDAKKNAAKARKRKIGFAVVQLALLCALAYLLIFVALPDIQSAAYEEGTASVALEADSPSTAYIKTSEIPTDSGSSEASETPAVSEAASEESESASDPIVFTTKYGTRYHRSGCIYLTNSSIETTLSAALAKGYTPCTRCNPPEGDAEESAVSEEPQVSASESSASEEVKEFTPLGTSYDDVLIGDGYTPLPVEISTGVLDDGGGECVAPLTISVSSDQNYYIRLKPIDADSDDIYCYISAGDTLEMLVPLGTYEMRYACGDTWYGEYLRFRDGTMYYASDEEFEFTYDSSSYQYLGWTVELILQNNGNLSRTEITVEEFDS